MIGDTVNFKLKNFIYTLIEQDLKDKKNCVCVRTRFAPEPNGYLHIGHAKAIYLNFSVAEYFNGMCNLRLDDTNPDNEDYRYVESIIHAVEWLGFDWRGSLYYASDYFDFFFKYAVLLIKMGKAYVCDLSLEQIREYRGTLKEPGRNSPYRNRSIEENLDCFVRMRNGEFREGSKVLRAKIDMMSPNINMRDPVMYRIKYKKHQRTGDKWCIYPTYDYAHCISDAIENVTYSLCTLEFADHRILYDWFLNHIKELPKPRQIEFARLNLTYTVMSKRKLLKLIEKKVVSGWNDPRMPTLLGLKRRGFPPEAICEFCERIGVTKQDSFIEMSYLEECVRQQLNLSVPRVLAVLKPLKIVITNFPEGDVVYLEAINHPKKPELGTRQVPFTRELYIEQDDFMEHPSEGFFRLVPGHKVRLRYGYIIKCEKVFKDPSTGVVVELHCSYDPNSRGVKTIGGKKVEGTIHWVSAPEAQRAEIRLFDRLFKVPNPSSSKDIDFMSHVSSSALIKLTGCFVEPALAKAKPEEKFQFERIGYFCVDYESTSDKLIFNRTVTLKDSWAM